MMEKICIVKRRRSYFTPETGGAGGISALATADDVLSHAAPEEREREVSLELTQEQSRRIRSDVRLYPGKPRMVNLETRESGEGRIIFHFTLSPLYGGKLLSSADVCWMLQVSRGFLARLVKNRQIDSYRIGRLRRFLFEDVIHYLGERKETPWQNT
jgi:excisionase family DNA binding protein